MKVENLYCLSITLIFAFSHCSYNGSLDIEVYETSASGNKLTKITEFVLSDDKILITLQPEIKYQKIIGFGGSFTESSAYLLNKLNKQNRDSILNLYFGDNGAKYSLTRTHINSCDFSLTNYSYAEVKDDVNLEKFTIEHDRDDIIPMIKDAMSISSEGFKIISSPWTAPPWMKDNQDWKGGKLLAEYYDTWALFFSKYLDAYKKEGIDIWAITVENEPLGNGSNWESMHFTAEEMNEFVKSNLGPQLAADGHAVKILGYDQNRGDELKHWTDVMYNDADAAKYFDGIAIHWYRSTFDYFANSLEYAHNVAPEKYLIHTEGCIDAEVPHWKDDAWYWKKEATDWGYDWAEESNKHLHPKYVPVYRYARNIIGSLNHWVEGWVDWNMVLDTKGGPNWANNWCIAPIIVDPDNDEIYVTPLYYTLSHFSRFIRPGAKRIGVNCTDEDLMVTALEDNKNRIVVIFNPSKEARTYTIQFDNRSTDLSINPQAIQTIII